tara:strand:- start:100 stop:270 length:171 start_codon:yes stop_codon:yes gene_type:complete
MNIYEKIYRCDLPRSDVAYDVRGGRMIALKTRGKGREKKKNKKNKKKEKKEEVMIL